MKPKKHPKNVSHTFKKCHLNFMLKRVLKPKKSFAKSNQMKKCVKVCENNESVYVNLYCREIFFGGASLNFLADVKSIKSSAELLCR